METTKRVEGAKRRAVQLRNYRRARDRALVRLTHAYPETYKQLLEQEKANDIRENKNWIDIDGTTNASITADTLGGRTLSADSTPADADKRENEGDDL